MRRVKADVLKELPEKIIQDYSCTLTPIQQKIYEKIVDSCIGINQKHVKNGAETKNSTKLLNPLQALILLRKVVDHPILIVNNLKELDENLAETITMVRIKKSFCSQKKIIASKTSFGIFDIFL